MKVFRSIIVPVGLLAGLLGAFSTGCQQSSHKSVRTYDYNNAPSEGRRTAQPVEREEDDGQWQMTTPGEMVVEPD